MLHETIAPVRRSRETDERKRSVAAEETAIPPRRQPGGLDELLTELTPTTIDQMDRDELIDVLRSVPVPFLRAESLRRLEHWDLSTLRRVVHLTCRCHQPQNY